MIGFNIIMYLTIIAYVLYQYYSNVTLGGKR